MRVKDRVIGIFLSIVVFLTTFLGFSVDVVTARAADNTGGVFETRELDFDNTSVNDDLQGMDLTGVKVNLDGTPALAKFVEYCFSENSLNSGNYAIYLYIFNPQKLRFSKRATANVVNMATGYNAEGNPNNYDNLSLKYCGVSTGEIADLIYKFRVMETDDLYVNAWERNKKQGNRRYDVAGFQLWEEGKAEGTVTWETEDRKVAKTYYYSGYAKGYANDTEAESTLACEVADLETIQVKPQFTNYRMPSDWKENHWREVNTAYFALDEQYITDFGNLQKIKAEWYEYKTSPIFVSDGTGSEAFYDYIGKNIGRFNEDIKWTIVSGDPNEAAMNGFYPVDYGWNAPSFEYDVVYNVIEQISWFFLVDKNYEDDENKVTREMVENYAKSYCEKYGKPVDFSFNGKQYSADLFANSIDEDRIGLLENPNEKRGHIVREFDAGETDNLLGYDSTHDGWERFWDYFLRWGEDTSAKTYSPIVEVLRSDLALSKENFCEKFLISEFDYTNFYNYAMNAFNKTGDFAGKNAQVVYLFRFANTDYHQVKMWFDDRTFGSSDQDGYMAEQTLFLNFDMIDLTFRKDGKDTVIPCICDPVDVFNGLGATQKKDNPMADFLELLEKLLFIALGIVGVMVVVWLLTTFAGPIGFFFKGVWTVISFPFKAIGGLFKNIKNNKNKKE